MRTIYKYDIVIGGETIIEMPEYAIPITAQMQGPHKLSLWAIVNADSQAPKEIRRFGVYGTGHRMPESFTWIATAQIMDGAVVLHVVEVDPK